MIRTFKSLYTPKLPVYYVYMLQQVEYEPKKFLDWFERLFKKGQPVQSTMYRKSLVYTLKAKLMLVLSYVFGLSLIVAVGYLFREEPSLLLVNWLVLLIALPYVMELFLVAVTSLAYFAIVKPQKKKLIKNSQKIFSEVSAKKIAVIGSYGKTTMKELLNTVLSEGFRVAATPGNMNVAVSHGRFARKLRGDEEIIIVEFGEGAPGDVLQMSQTVQPDYAVVTGLAPNHLDHYPSVDAIAEDLLSVYDYVDAENITISGESSMLKEYIPKKAHIFSSSAVMGWKITKIKVSFEGIDFVMKKAKSQLAIHSGLLGRHQVAPVAYAAALAHELGASKKDIEAGCRKTKAFEHRMQPRNVHGAWIIDDTYNGNLEGLKAGLGLLSELPGHRKWYITPGLVDQGSENERVHTELGKAIAAAHPDVVVLMDNSARPIIEKAIKSGDYSGDLRIETDPLQLYTNIEHVLAMGDIVLMQNDWTDNYN